MKRDDEVPTAVLLTIQVFWNITLCRTVNSYQRLAALLLPSE
jgi:hypothetical protein